MTIVATEREPRGDAERVGPLEGAPADSQEIPGWSGRIMVWLRVVAQLVGIQVLMIVGTVLGLVVAGLGPALTSGSALLARLRSGDASDALWRDFWTEYLAHWRRASLVTAPAILAIALVWYELLVLQAYGSGALTAILTGASAAVGLCAIAYLSYAPHVLRRYDDPAFRTARFLLVGPLVSPLTALGCMVTGVALLVIGLRFPLLLVLVGLAIPVLLTGLLVDRFLDRVDARHDGEDEPSDGDDTSTAA